MLLLLGFFFAERCRTVSVQRSGLAVGVELCKKANGCCFLRCPIQFSTEVFIYMNGIFIHIYINTPYTFGCLKW